MPATNAVTSPKQMSLEATVIRADGTREELGAVAYWHRNPLRRWWWALPQTLRGRTPGRSSRPAHRTKQESMRSAARINRNR